MSVLGPDREIIVELGFILESGGAREALQRAHSPLTVWSMLTVSVLSLDWVNSFPLRALGALPRKAVDLDYFFLQEDWRGGTWTKGLFRINMNDWKS